MPDVWNYCGVLKFNSAPCMRCMRAVQFSINLIRTCCKTTSTYVLCPMSYVYVLCVSWFVCCFVHTDPYLQCSIIDELCWCPVLTISARGYCLNCLHYGICRSLCGVFLGICKSCMIRCVLGVMKTPRVCVIKRAHDTHTYRIHTCTLPLGMSLRHVWHAA